MNLNSISNLELMRLAFSKQGDTDVTKECARRFLLPYRDKPKHDKIMQQLSKALVASLKNNLKEIYLYGSRARYEHKPYSDMDIAIILDKVSTEDNEIIDTLAANLSVSEDIVIHAYAIPIAKFNNPDLQEGLYSNIRKEGIKYYG